ncbi:MAG: hypothetical protein KKF62_06855 [Bacteroidetes bacterium]|nr:hypothetical protein [Bacteroidota bacterium]MBU1115190.1 hypothetical protein [Bacteroidota bacterium]MBU1799282.1 hypothetical protein [Bacteroidota bacterium]
MKVHSEDLTGNYYTEDKVLANQIASKLLNFGKKYIQSDYDENYDYIQKLRENAQFNSIPLPPEISEKFIFYENAPNYLMFESPLISYLHKIFKVNHTMLGGNNPQLQLKEYYIKWLKQKKGTDTKYFANSMLHYLEKTKNNAFNLLIHAMLLSYDEELFDPEKSVELINRASEIIFNKHIDNEFINELKYFLKTIEGFFYLKGSNLDQSNKMFYEALDLKHTGITAKFHLALTEVHLENIQLGAALVEEIYNTDIARLNFAIQNNSFSVYEFFLNHSITKYFFLEPKFFPVLYFFEDKIELFRSHNKASFDEVKKSLFNLQEIKVTNYFTDRIQANLKFIEIYVKKYNGNESLLLSDSSQEVVRKFDEIIEIIGGKITQKYQEGFQERLKIFDSKIDELKINKSHLENELETYQRRINEKLKIRLNDFESQMDIRINSLESQVNKVDERNDLDPTVVFKNAFTYTSMLSVLVLLLAGFASYTNSEFKEMANFSNVIKTVIVEGAQWSLITFLVGTIISIFTTISTIVQKSSFKQNMVRKVKNYIDEKERGKVELRKETEFTIKQFEQKTKSRIQSFEEEIADYIEKRKLEAERLQNEANGKIQLELQKLHGFYK